ncbi:Sugar kinase, ROK family [Spiroplasma clarkii]|uniref:ROK family sugar kinase n=1 Tax=Spiroplasma clarkii TaxID=2139 RepID=A0A1Y0KZU3_9MOLU|nr:ROK family protein [Spiroplasma clarkii]ARU91050.1 Sugar kinase, ROK family [Spiroplasma clarkii]ATX70485.1 ROK family sugar kinase [Spiroplasma clarkii]
MKLCIDIGGMSCKFAVFDERQRVIFKTNAKYGQLIDYIKLEKLLFENVELIIKEHQIDSICIATPGIIDPETGQMTGISAIEGQTNFNSKTALAEKFNLPVFIENDANCAAIAELRAGAAINSKNAVFIVVGTGVGGALVVNNSLYHGSFLRAGEFGGALYLNNQDEVKNYSAAAGMNFLQNYYKSLAKSSKSGEEIYDSYHTDQFAKQAIDTQISRLANLILFLATTLDPDVVVIGGGISANQLFMDLLQTELQTISKLADFEFKTKIKKALFENDANLLGAYFLNEE